MSCAVEMMCWLSRDHANAYTLPPCPASVRQRMGARGNGARGRTATSDRPPVCSTPLRASIAAFSCDTCARHAARRALSGVVAITEPPPRVPQLPPPPPPPPPARGDETTVPVSGLLRSATSRADAAALPAPPTALPRVLSLCVWPPGLAPPLAVPSVPVVALGTEPTLSRNRSLNPAPPPPPPMIPVPAALPPMVPPLPRRPPSNVVAAGTLPVDSEPVAAMVVRCGLARPAARRDPCTWRRNARARCHTRAAQSTPPPRALPAAACPFQQLRRRRARCRRSPSARLCWRGEVGQSAAASSRARWAGRRNWR